MSLYRKVSVRMWGDEKFRALSRPRPNAQSLFVYLFTGPHTGIVPGLFVAGERQLAEALKWPLPSFRRCFKELESAGMARADWVNRVVYLPRAKTHNPPANTNIIKGWAAGFKDLPDCTLVASAWTDFRTHGDTEAMTDAFREAFAKAFGQDFGNSMSSSMRREEHEHWQSNGKGFDALTSSKGQTKPTKDEQLDALAQRSGLTRAELKAQADALAATVATTLSAGRHP